LDVEEWRKNVDYKKFEELRRLYNEAGINIYAFKPRVFGKENSDDAIRYGMRAAKALGASHVTLEHPEDDEHTARLGKIAEEEGMLVGYHGHEQQTPTLWDTALSQSEANRLNLDFGHYIAAENQNPLEIIKNKHEKIVSMHLKDRKKKSNGGDNLMWGQGETPIKEVLQLIRDNGYDFPVTIELEYDIPEGSNAVEEVKNCIAYVQSVL
jgi:sugar phosphate isomerase/epimerase